MFKPSLPSDVALDLFISGENVVLHVFLLNLRPAAPKKSNNPTKETGIGTSSYGTTLTGKVVQYKGSAVEVSEVLVAESGAPVLNQFLSRLDEALDLSLALLAKLNLFSNEISTGVAKSASRSR